MVLETIENFKKSFCQIETALFDPEYQNFLNAVALASHWECPIRAYIKKAAGREGSLFLISVLFLAIVCKKVPHFIKRAVGHSLRVSLS